MPKKIGIDVPIRSVLPGNLDCADRMANEQVFDFRTAIDEHRLRMQLQKLMGFPGGHMFNGALRSDVLAHPSRSVSMPQKNQGPDKRGPVCSGQCRQAAACIVRRTLKRGSPSSPAPFNNRVPGSGTPPPPPPVLQPGGPGGALSQVQPASEISLK